MSSSPVPATAPVSIFAASTASPVSRPSFNLTSTATSTSSEDHHATTQTFPPMTTYWTKPQSCTWTYVVENVSLQASSGAVAWLDLEPRSGASTLSCYPDGMFFDGRTGVFSPATCPNGWTTVSLRVNTDEDAMQATTTAICCSSYYSLDGSHCKRSVPTVLAVPISYNRTASTYDIMTNSTTTLTSATMAVNTIRALFMEQDKKQLGLTNENEIGDVPDKSRPLTIGARVGIALGVAGFVSITLAAITYCILRRRRRRRKKAAPQGQHELACVPDMYGPAGGRLRDGTVAEPPPAYEASLSSSSTNPADGEGENTAARDEEIRVLVAQKAAIQRRLEELERVDDTRNP
ncbi:hypothetical protein JDV02_001286 [Purpureocillium takamizusanense]|uniref:Uncharacterized protein n=1 Tax=Purpureocillium takamizusanense TaxID=2060973 RepID=A0A9Q8Q8H5_9HYPO|nr:uncharacterized protein JDV02_001286 [Purpureocillium takamizusanense]UNI14682.1 hypothetical protein JDV02_001286 [Purpureocillium takamizusanense]